jgi:hypothetical protein
MDDMDDTPIPHPERMNGVLSDATTPTPAVLPTLDDSAQTLRKRIRQLYMIWAREKKGEGDDRDGFIKIVREVLDHEEAVPARSVSIRAICSRSNVSLQNHANVTINNY